MGTLILIDEDAPVAVEFIELTTNGSGSSMSIAANFGADVTGRKLVIAVHCTRAGTVDLTNAVVGGESAWPPIVGETGESGQGTYWIVAENVSGTSGNIDLTFSGTHGARCGIWHVTNAESASAVAFDSEAWGFDSVPHTVNVNVEEGGAVFAAFTGQSNLPDFTAGVTVEDYSEEFVPTSPIKVGGGFALTASTVGGLAVTIDHAGGGSWRGNYAVFSIR